MKKSLIKKLALITGTAVAFSSFAFMTTGCSKDEKKSKDKKDKDDKKVEETEETEAEETETPVETTEVVVETEETEETVDIDPDAGIDFDFDVETIKDAELKAIAAEYLKQDYMFFSFEDMGEELPDGCTEGFYGMGSDFSSMVLGAKFDDKESAEAYAISEFSDEEVGFEMFDKEETEDGDVYSMTVEGTTVTITVFNSGVLLIDAQYA